MKNENAAAQNSIEESFPHETDAFHPEPKKLQIVERKLRIFLSCSPIIEICWDFS